MKFAALTLTALLLAGCGTPNTALFDTTHRAPTIAVEIYHEGQHPDRPYREIGALSQEYFAGEDAVVLANFVKQARKAGGDAIVILPGRAVGFKFDPFGRSGSRYVWRASLIVWKEDTTTKPAGQHTGA